MDDFNVFIAGALTGVVMFLGSLALQDNLVAVETDKLTNTKYVKYNNSVYVLVPYKNITKEK